MTIKELKAKDWIIYEIEAGSKLYNIMNEDSDTDVRGIYSIPLYEYLCQRSPSKITINNETEDIVFMEIVTYLRLIAKGNPNVVDWLFSPDALDSCTSLEMKEFIDIRDEFVTKQFLSRSLAMGQSMLSGAFSETADGKDVYNWKKLAHAGRILLTVSNYLITLKYDPVMKGGDRDIIMKLREGKEDFWSSHNDIELGTKSLLDVVRTEKDIPDKVADKTIDELILQFKTKYYGVETP